MGLIIKNHAIISRNQASAACDPGNNLKIRPLAPPQEGQKADTFRPDQGP